MFILVLLFIFVAGHGLAVQQTGHRHGRRAAHQPPHPPPQTPIRLQGVHAAHTWTSGCGRCLCAGCEWMHGLFLCVNVWLVLLLQDIHICFHVLFHLYLIRAYAPIYISTHIHTLQTSSYPHNHTHIPSTDAHASVYPCTRTHRTPYGHKITMVSYCQHYCHATLSGV